MIWCHGYIAHNFSASPGFKSDTIFHFLRGHAIKYRSSCSMYDASSNMCHLPLAIPISSACLRLKSGWLKSGWPRAPGLTNLGNGVGQLGSRRQANEPWPGLAGPGDRRMPRMMTSCQACHTSPGFELFVDVLSCFCKFKKPRIDALPDGLYLPPVVLF